MELDLDKVYRMTLAEFQMRSIGFRQKEIRAWRKFRKVAFNALLGPSADPKRLPKSEIAFMRLPGDLIPRATEEQKELLLSEMREYIAKSGLKPGQLPSVE